MQDSKPTGTPVDVNSKLQPATNQADPVNQTEYQSAIGSFVYLAVSTRPDIAFTVNNLARFNSNPQNSIKASTKVSQGNTQLWDTLQARWVR